MSRTPWVIGTGPAVSIATGLGTGLDEVPAVAFDAEWSDGPRIEEWRSSVAAGPKADQVVVAVWPESPRPSPVVDLDLDGWVSTMEEQFALWFAALAAGSERCADGGQVVAVVDRPDPMASGGWSAVSAVADAVEVMTRSFAQIHESRGVRVNLVTTPSRLTGSPPEELADVVGAVAMLLSGAGGVTSSVVHTGGARR